MRVSDGLRGSEELREAANAVGLSVELQPSGDEPDIVLVNPAGGTIVAQVKRVSLASVDGLERRMEDWARQPHPDIDIRVVVADRVTEQARRMLTAAGWSWLDLRGHLHLVGDGLFIDADVPRLNEANESMVPLLGRVSQEVSALLLMTPTRSASVREIARTLNRAPSSVSEAIKALREAGLVDGHRKPVTPSLFWQLAERWRPLERDLQHYPLPTGVNADRSVNDALRLGLEDVVGTTGWALTDTVAAAAYDAPVGVRSGHPPDFYVPDQMTMRRALHLLGPAPNHESRGATIRLAPLPMVCADRIDFPHETWPLAQPLFVALDLARDPGRGREILEGWTPPASVGHRVW